MDHSAKLLTFDTWLHFESSLYRPAIQSLIWLTHMRLDIAYLDGHLSSFFAIAFHLYAAHVLRYLNATLHHSILFGRGSTLVGYVDVDLAG